MKTVSGKISFAALAIFAITAAALCLSACPHGQVSADDDNDEKFMLKIGNRNKNHWVDVNQDTFDTALKNLPQDAKWNISFLCKDGDTAQDNYDPGDPHHHEVCIKTDKVKKSEAADSVAAGASAANDPNATQHVRVNRAQDLKAVLAAFAEPSPTPTP